MEISTSMLLRLAQHDDIDGVLRLVEPEEIARAWIRRQQRVGNEDSAEDDDDPDWWAVEVWLSDDWSNHETAVRRALITLVDEAPEDLLEDVGAGPLEDHVLCTDDYRDTVAWLVPLAMGSERWRRALRVIHVAHELPEDLIGQLETAVGARLPRPH